MQFRVLGPLEAVRDGAAVDLGSPRQRQVLSLLLMHVGEEVPLEHLLDALWEGDGRENAVYIAISRLRSALGDDGQALVTGDHGYRLAIDPQAVDAVRFADLVRQARSVVEDDPAAARAAFTRALALWHGPAWSELRYVDAAVPEIERIDELRTSATEDLLSLRLGDGESGAVLAEATALHREHPLRERPVHLMMEALYRSGRQAEALRVFRRFEQQLGEELGVEPSPRLRRLEERILVHDRSVQSSDGGEGVNPYQGLRPFREPDANRFFGRSRLVASVLEAIDAGETIVTLVGASGSGKSSVARAGVVPALRGGALPGSDQWVVATMVPGSRPFVELEAALTRAVPRAPAGLPEQLGTPDTGILAAGLSLLPDDAGRLVVVVDQLEELFTLTTDLEVRRRFLDALVTAAEDPRRRLVFLLTLRADRYHLALEQPRFAERFDDGVVHVPPMLPGELEAAAVEPARLAGADVDPALLTTLVADVGGRPGSLPLFQYALTELYDEGRPILSLADYEAAGGLHGAIGRRAESVFAGFLEHEQHACRHLFLRMVAINDEGETRRRLAIGEAHALGLDEATVEAVVNAFVDARLVTTDENPATHEATVEVAHEALFAAWHRLATWLDDAGQDLHRHVVLATAVGEWETAGHDPSYLWSGRRLAGYQAWAADSGFRLDAGEQAFLQASAEAEKDRARRDRRTTRSRRRVIAILAAAVVLAVAGGVSLTRTVILGSEPVATAFVLASTDDDTATRQLTEGLAESVEAIDVAVEVTRPGMGPDIPAALDRGHEFLVIGLDGADAYPPGIWNYIERERLASTQVIDLTIDDVRPVVNSDGDRAEWARPLFADIESGILAGAMAALHTETGTVAFVGTHPGQDLGQLWGFAAGVAEEDPSVRVLAAYTPSFGHPGWLLRADAARLAESTTEAVIAQGADVVFEAHGKAGIGVARAAADASGRVQVIGSGHDLHAEVAASEPRAGETVLASVVRHYDRATAVAIERLMAGEPVEDRRIGVADGGIEVVETANRLSSTARSEVARLTAEFVAVPIEETWMGSRAAMWLGSEAAAVLGRVEQVVGADLEATAGDGAGGPWIIAPELIDEDRIPMDQILTVSATNDLRREAGLWIAVGRAGSMPPPEILFEPPWEMPWIWADQAPKVWAHLPPAALDQEPIETAVSAILDRPGTWMIGVGVYRYQWLEGMEAMDAIAEPEDPEGSPTARQPVWYSFEVVEPDQSS